MPAQSLPHSSRLHPQAGILKLAFVASFFVALTTLAWNASFFAPTSSLSVLVASILAIPSRILQSSANSTPARPSEPVNQTFTLTRTYTASSFLNDFIFEAIPDPTHGRVNYVDKETALARGLVSVNDEDGAKEFVLRADSSRVVKNGERGRDSVRIRSREAWKRHLAIFDVRHMPEGCGTWPALWETSERDWPAQGEVDIIEGVNDQGPNAMTLHTTVGCSMPSRRNMTGKPLQTDCNWLTNYNAGCGVASTRKESYGKEFNAAEGGWYILERTNDYIRFFFWAREDGGVPEVVKSGGEIVSTDDWVRYCHFCPLRQEHC